MNDCKQFNGTLDFFFSQEENLNLIDHYFKNFNFKGKVVLDAGCRNGGITKAFFDKGASSIGIDINKKAIEKAIIIHQGPQFFLASVVNLTMFNDSSFDVIFCLGTLPYLNSDQIKKTILEFQRVVKPGGRILLAFQKDKAPLFIFMAKTYNLLPLIFRPTLIFIACIYFKTLNLKYLRYSLCEGLVGINFGYPKDLKPLEVPTPNCRMISSKYSKTFLLKK